MTAVNQNILAQLLVGPAQAQQLQNQTALGEQLQQQGMTPLETPNAGGRIVGRISPVSGLAKIAQTMLGTYEKQDANQQLAKAMAAQLGDGGMGAGGAPAGGAGGAAPAQGGQPLSTFNIPGVDHRTIFLAMQGDPVSKAIVDHVLKNQELPDSVRNAQYGFNGNTPAAQSAVAAQFQTPEQRNAAASGLPNPLALKGQEAIASAAAPGAAAQLPVGMMPGTGAQGGPASIPAPPSPGALSDQVQGFASPPPVQASELAAPGAPPAGIPLSGNQPPSAMPQQAGMLPPIPGETNAQFEVRKKAAEAGQTAQATDMGKNLAEAQKGAATIDSRIGNAKDLIRQATVLAPKTSYGFGTETKEAIHNQANDETSVSNASFKNIMANLLTQALPAVVEGTGGKIDIPLLNSIKEAENLDLHASPKAKAAVLNNLSMMLDKQQQNMRNQVSAMGGQQQPVSSQTQEGAIAVNKNTGQRIKLVNGQWVPQ